jgi:hypothetical protein
VSHDHLEIERRLRPGAWDTAGFLLPDESLAERIAEDIDTCARLDASPEAIGLRLADLLSSAAETDFARPQRHGEFQVVIVHQRGLLTCPWAPDEFETCPVTPEGSPTANRFQINRGGHMLEGFQLSAHLIGAHSFFGGTGTRFRIEPAHAAPILGDS